METYETLIEKIKKDKAYKDKTVEEIVQIIEKCQVKRLVNPEKNKKDIVDNYNSMNANLEPILQLSVKYVDEDGNLYSDAEITAQVARITEDHNKYLANLEKQLFAIYQWEVLKNG